MIGRRVGFAAIAALLVSGFAMLHAGKSFAQSTIGLTPPTVSAVDRNGVDLVSGNLTLGLPSISAGSSGSGLARTGSGYNLPYGDNFNGTLNGGSDSTGTYMLVSIGSKSEKFYGPASVTSGSTTVTYTPEIAGDTFSCVSYICTYTLTDGTTAVFDQNYDSTVGIASRYGAMTSLTKPDGEVLRFYYMFHPNVGTIPGYGPVDILGLRAVTSSLGWMVRYDTATPGSSVSPSKIYIINTSVDYCDPTSDTPCTAADSATWPTMTIGSTGGNPTYTINGNTTTLSVGSYGSPVSQEFATGETSPTGVTITSTHTGEAVSSVTVGGQTWTYTYSTSGTVKTSTATDPNSHVARIITSDIATGHVLSDQNAAGQVTKYTYYTTTGSGALKGKVWQVIASDATYSGTTLTGGYAQYEYDARGNVTQITVVPKNGGTPMIQLATYPCTVAKACNKPATVTDVNGVVTTYTYDPNSGEVATKTLPSPAAGGIAPQIRYTYAQITPHHYEVPGHYGVLTADAPVWRLVSTSTCMTTSSCAGTADEARTTISYGSNNANPTYNNILPVSVTKQIGNANLGTAASGTNVWQTTTYTYDSNGHVIVTDGPKPGAVDETYTFYDGLGRVQGVVGADPDGAAGSRHRQASHTYYDADGHVSEIDTGIVGAGNTDAYSGSTAAARWAQAQTDWNSLTIQERNTNEFDTYGRPVVARHYIGTSSTAKDVTQRSYDNMQRIDCEAVRLNPADYASLPSSACTLGTTNSDGSHDRITKYAYDALGNLTSTISAYGTASARTDATKTYDIGATGTGTLQYVTDAKGNMTHYYYDAFDRQVETCYPTASNGSVVNTSDCDHTFYRATTVTGQAQATNLVDYIRKRDNTTTISFTYDLLGRISTKSGAVSETFTYDNFNDVITHVNNTTGGASASETYTYNALAWLTSDAQPMGTVSYGYDAYGRRTSMTYPGSFVVNYAYDNGNELTDETATGTSVHFAYDDYGRRSSLTRGNGVTTTYAYDSNLRLHTLTQGTSGASFYNQVTYGYNAADQISSKTGTNAGYDYAPAANSISYSIDGLNRISSVSGTTFAYDAWGNLTSDGGTGSYSYNPNNLMTSATQSGVTTTLTYDAENRLFSITKNGTTTKFLYDGTDLIAEYNGSTVLRRYVHGPGDDEPLIWYEGSGTGAYDYIHADDNGSVDLITNSAGAEVTINTYDPYGLPGSGNTGRFQYTGQVWLPEIGMYYYKARLYNPVIGRFMQTDPIGYGDGMNWYAYVHGDPVNGSDPSGLQDCDPGQAGSGHTIICSAQDLGTVVVVHGCDLSCQHDRSDQLWGQLAYAGHWILGAGSFCPSVCGSAFAGADGLLYWAQGKKVDAALSFGAAAIGLVSDAGGVKAGEEGAKLAFDAVKAADKACGCFVEGTEVETPNGLVPIEEIEVGDQVLAYNEQTGQIVSEPVLGLIRPAPKATFSLVFKGEHGEADTFRATADHPWFTTDHKWVHTEDLKAGDKIETATGQAFTLASIKLSGKIEQTYNLEVNGLHTFLVGKDHLVVHNSCTWITDVSGKSVKVANKLLSTDAPTFMKNLTDSGFVEKQLSNGAVELTKAGSDVRYVVRNSDSFGQAVDVYNNGVRIAKYGFH